MPVAVVSGSANRYIGLPTHAGLVTLSVGVGGATLLITTFTDDVIAGQLLCVVVTE